MPRLAVLAVVAVIAGCGGGTTAGAEAAPIATAASADCGRLPAAAPKAALPRGFPTLPGQVLYGPELQGKTRILYGRIATADFVATRDRLVTMLQASGYTIPGTDQESVEAEAEFAGPHEGTIKIQPLCKGTIRIRYKLLS